ncbi:hypothetical protein [Streptomyces sp. NPDC056628]|uniref:hypothetical protein n=1 Tax=Streptomyces sp. NPDC056628 TaxID=3345882 RepID=UPI0036B9FC50
MSAPDDRTADLGPRRTEPAEDTGYSATVLGSHWIQRPAPDADGTLVAPAPRPDRAENTVLRFGPGVTASVAQRTHRTLPALPPPPAPAPRRLRRHALPALVLLCVLAFLAWQRLGPSVGVRSVAVTARPAVLPCDGTADVVAVVATDGRPGTLTYRWTRSDGTASGVLREVVARDQRQARLTLRWTFEGQGRRTAEAEVEILSPARLTADARFTYDCG